MSYTDEEKEKIERQLSIAVDKVLEGIEEFNVAANAHIKCDDYNESYMLELNHWRIKFNKLQLRLLSFKDDHGI
jgi:hypothetical protein